MSTINVILALVACLPSQPSTLRGQAARLNLNLGSCVSADLLLGNAEGGEYARALAREMTMVEPENDLKPPALWRGLNNYDFTKADVILGAPGKKGWAAKQGLTVRGHVLVYARDEGYTIPRWLVSDESKITPEQAKTYLHNYIHTVVGRYKGKIAFWDVVNEAIDDQKNSRPFNLRNSFWFRKLGPEFLLLAFQYAHEVDPKAELYYNEYGVEGGGPKAEALLALADYLKSHHAPISGIGLQYHTTLDEHVVPGDGHYQLLEAIRGRGLAFMITELDLGINVVNLPKTDPLHGLKVQDDADLHQQADRYADIFKMALGFPNCHGIQMWGITDRHSWIPDFSRTRGAALLFDADYRPKPAYEAVLHVLTNAQRK